MKKSTKVSPLVMDERRRKKNEQQQIVRKRKRGADRGRTAIPDWTIGVDLGDEESYYCVLDKEGNVDREGSVRTEKTEFQKVFGGLARSRVVMEVGTHSPWVSRCVKEAGHEVIVANARKVKLIAESSEKDDKLDAEMLARLGRVDVQLLSPIEHRGKEAQGDLVLIRTRSALVRARTQLVNTARGLVKSMGERLPRCAAEKMNEVLGGGLSESLQGTLKPMLKAIGELSQRITEYDVRIEQLCKERYPETRLLTAVSGVGSLIALTFVLTLEEPGRFGRSRQVGPYLGLRPGRRDSGKSRPQLRISKEGDTYLRSLLIQAAHCILRSTAEDSDLKRFGLKLCKRGGKNGRKRAKVAVARRLAVLLHHLWGNGEVYDPLYNEKGKRGKKAA